MQIEISLNDKTKWIEVAPDEMLADALRKTGMLSIRKGCDTSCCGLCTVWVGENPVLSCTMPAFRAEGKKSLRSKAFRPKRKNSPVFWRLKVRSNVDFAARGSL